jgi:hypothetical protein
VAVRRLARCHMDGLLGCVWSCGQWRVGAMCVCGGQWKSSLGTGAAGRLAMHGDGVEHATGTWLLWRRWRAGSPGKTTM